ncbi:hypothetical protein CLOM_g7873 [Closterium sp. NIES-68]|nr:hypothetical protein CLOM_g7873 [Closterium sp. NIES-68]
MRVEIFPDDLPTGLPPSRPEDHRIELEPGAQPTVQRQFRLSQPELEELQQPLDYLLTKGFIRPSTSPYAAAKLFTRRRMEDSAYASTTAHSTGSQSSRVIRSRELTTYSTTTGSKVLIENRLAMRLPSNCVAADNCHKTAFRTRYGSFEYLVCLWPHERALAFQMT